MTRHIDLLREQQKAASRKAKTSETSPARKAGDEEILLPPEDDAPATTPVQAEDFGSALPDEKTAISDPSMQTTPQLTLPGWLAALAEMLLAAFRSAAKNQAFDFTPMFKQVDKIIHKVGEDPRILNEFELMLANNEKALSHLDPAVGDLVQKAITMMLYALKVGRQLRLADTSLQELAFAAMLHQIGLAQVPVEIRHKKDRLSAEERDTLRSATSLSVAFLRKCGLDNETILKGIEHSGERWDGSGPLGLKENEICLEGRIVGLLSMFEALIHYRPYRQRLLPRDAIRMLIKDYKQQFNHDILKALIDSISLYPPGTFVQLNSGDIGQVIDVNPRLPLRPKVRICFNRDGRPIQEKEIDLTKQPNLMVKSCMYPEALAETAA